MARRKTGKKPPQNEPRNEPQETFTSPNTFYSLLFYAFAALGPFTGALMLLAGELIQDFHVPRIMSGSYMFVLPLATLFIPFLSGGSLLCTRIKAFERAKDAKNLPATDDDTIPRNAYTDFTREIFKTFTLEAHLTWFASSFPILFGVFILTIHIGGGRDLISIIKNAPVFPPYNAAILALYAFIIVVVYARAVGQLRSINCKLPTDTLFFVSPAQLFLLGWGLTMLFALEEHSFAAFLVRTVILYGIYTTVTENIRLTARRISRSHIVIATLLVCGSLTRAYHIFGFLLAIYGLFYVVVAAFYATYVGHARCIIPLLDKHFRNTLTYQPIVFTTLLGLSLDIDDPLTKKDDADP